MVEEKQNSCAAQVVLIDCCHVELKDAWQVLPPAGKGIRPTQEMNQNLFDKIKVFCCPLDNFW